MTLLTRNLMFPLLVYLSPYTETELESGLQVIYLCSTACFFDAQFSLSLSALRTHLFDPNHDNYTERQPQRDTRPRAAYKTARFNPDALGIDFPILVI